jgi:uncharacterized protein (DUF983 family)
VNTKKPSGSPTPLTKVAFAARCPRCGEGALFDGFLTVAASCKVCGLSLAGHDTGDGPAFFIMMPLCIIVAVLALLTDLRFEPPLWLHMVMWPLVIIGLVAATLRPVKGVMIALQYRHRDIETDGHSNQQ